MLFLAREYLYLRHAIGPLQAAAPRAATVAEAERPWFADRVGTTLLTAFPASVEMRPPYFHQLEVFCHSRAAAAVRSPELFR